MTYTRQQILDIINQQIPIWIQKDDVIKEAVLRLTEKKYVSKSSFDDRFDRMLNELKRMREQDSKKWEENQKKWEENQKKWEEWNRRWNEKQQEDKKKWEKNQREIRHIYEEIRAQNRKIDSTFGAIGARWGINTETTFRNAIAGMLKDYANVTVERIVERDKDGEVFGEPAEIELDMLIKNSVITICEIKSSCSIADMNLFAKKAVFYENLHGMKNCRKVLISPMVEEKARLRAEKLLIEVYTSGIDVKI